jgi:hypothetical protein
MLWPVFELDVRSEEKTHKSALPESKSKFKVWPPTDTGTRYSTPPDGEAGAELSCRFSRARADRKASGNSLVGFKFHFL